MDSEADIMGIERERPLLFPEHSCSEDLIYMFSMIAKSGVRVESASMVRRALDDFAAATNAGRRLS